MHIPAVDFAEIDRQARLGLKAARLASGMEPDQLAQFTGNSPSAYWDLEAVDSEISSVLDLQDIAGLCKTLGISGRRLFGSNSVGPTLTPETIVQNVREHLVKRGISLDQFEDMVGYYLKDALENPKSVWKDWNVDCLRSVCVEIGLNWEEFFE